MHFGHLAQERETIGSINAISFSLFSAPMQTTVDEGRPTYVKYVFFVFLNLITVEGYVFRMLSYN